MLFFTLLLYNIVLVVEGDTKAESSFFVLVLISFCDHSVVPHKRVRVRMGLPVSHQSDPTMFNWQVLFYVP